MQRNCDACGSPYEARARTSKYCQEADCRRARERARKSGTSNVPSASAAVAVLPGANERVTAAELDRAGRLETVAGQNALTLARRLDAAAGDTGSSFAALAKQHLAAVDRALEGVQAQEDPIDQRKKAMQERRLSVVR